MKIQKPKPSKPNQNPNEILRYSGLAFQMIATICLGVFLGNRLDKYLHTPKPYFTGLFAVIFVVLAVYNSIADFLKK